MKLMVIAAAILLVAAVAYLPEEVLGFLPACPLRRLTGLLCPMCGSTGAVRSLARGDWSAAWQGNPLLLVGLGSLALFAAGRALPGTRAAALGPGARRAIAIGVCAAVVAFTVARNWGR